MSTNKSSSTSTNADFLLQKTTGQTKTIYDLNEILINQNDNYSNGTLCIDIDKACMIEEKIIAQLFNSNSILRNKIIASTNRLHFDMTDNLILTRSNMCDFIKKCKNVFNNVNYVTKKSPNEIDKIKQYIIDNAMPCDIDIVTFDMIKSRNIETLFYIDTNNDSFNELIEQNKIKNNIGSKLFIIFPIHF